MMDFQEPVNPEAYEKIVKHFGEPVATDKKTFLFNDMNRIEQRAMKEIANAAKQPATVAVVGEGEIKTFSDGTRYQVTNKGWVRLP